MTIDPNQPVPGSQGPMAAHRQARTRNDVWQIGPSREETLQLPEDGDIQVFPPDFSEGLDGHLFVLHTHGYSIAVNKLDGALHVSVADDDAQIPLVVEILDGPERTFEPETVASTRGELTR